jgi:hypothetical protein
MLSSEVKGADGTCPTYGLPMWLAELIILVVIKFVHTSNARIATPADGLRLKPGPVRAFAALVKALTATTAQFFTEVAAKGDKQEVIKRSGLTYLMRLRVFQSA